MGAFVSLDTVRGSAYALLASALLCAAAGTWFAAGTARPTRR
jgi:hypothetical protein